MYTDDYEGKEAEKGARRAYVSNIPQDEAEELLRENDKLKKQLEKEQFFNKLLDQEIQELKANQGQPEHQVSNYWYGSKGVSKTAFYCLLVVTLGMAGYIGYGIYSDKEADNIISDLKIPSAQKSEAAAEFSTPDPTPAENTTNGVAQTPTETPKTTLPDLSPTLPLPTSTKNNNKDSVPNIIAAKPVEKEKPKKVEEVDIESTGSNAPAEPLDTRPIIARYKITSKANFYNSPDENTMRGTFISQGDDKVVGALEDRNGFIFVAYTNDLGYTSKGWLSKKDLSRAD